MTTEVQVGGSLLAVEFLDAFGAGVYLLFGVIHLDLWFRRRERLGYLWLACASLSALVVDISGMVIRRAGGEPAALLNTLNLLGVAFACAFLFEFVCSTAHRPAGRLGRTGQCAVLVLALLAGPFALPVQPPLLVGCGALLVWAMARAFIAAHAGDRESGAVAGGFLILTACLIADILQEVGVPGVPGGLPIIGFTVLFLTSARALNDRFDQEEEASRHDSLTGLPNRRGFLEAGDGALARSRRSGKAISILLSDLDLLKRVNDTLGHAAGDAALRDVAQALRAAVRAQDVVARWGGDEFIFLLPDTELAGAALAAETVRVAVASLPVAGGQAGLQLTLSLGVAEHRPGRNLEETIAEADAALYRAKEFGRNRVEA